MIYYITKSAIYLHGVTGPYPNKRAAMRAFKKAYDDETGEDYNNNFDGHHDYHLIKRLAKDVGDNLTADDKAELLPYQPKRK